MITWGADHASHERSWRLQRTVVHFSDSFVQLMATRTTHGQSWCYYGRPWCHYGQPCSQRCKDYAIHVQLVFKAFKISFSIFKPYTFYVNFYDFFFVELINLIIYSQLIYIHNVNKSSIRL